MGLYNLTLLKESGEKNGGASNGDRRLLVFGYYDYLLTERLDNFSDVFRQTTAENLEITGFSRHNMTVFDVNSPNDAESQIIDKLIHKSESESDPERFVIVFSCVIRKIFDETSDIKTGRAAIEWAKERLLEKLQLWKHDSECADARYQVLGNLGNFDVTILIESDILPKLVGFPNWLRNVFEREDTDRGIENKDEATIVYSSSFIACDLKQIAKRVSEIGKNNDERLNLNIHLATFNSSSDEQVKTDLLTALERHGYGKDNLICSRIVGEYSTEVLIEGVRAPDIVRLFTDENNYVLNPENRKNKEVFRSMYTLIGLTDKGTEGSNASGVPKRKTPSTVDVENKLVETYKNLEESVPAYLRYSLVKCIRDAIVMIRNDLKHILGWNLVLLLIDFFEDAQNAKAKYNEGSDEDLHVVWASIVEKFIGECSAFLSCVHPQACFLQDSQENQNEVNAILKVFLAYPQMVEDIARAVNIRKGNEPSFVPRQVLINIGSSPKFSTRIYEWPILADVIDSGDDDKAVMGFISTLNFPNAKSLAIRDILEPYIHEVCHCLFFFGRKKSTQNEALHKVLFQYCVARIMGDLRNRIEINNDNAPEIRQKIEIVLQAAINDKFGIREGLPGEPPDCLINNASIGAFKKWWYILLAGIGDSKGDFKEERRALAASELFIKIISKAAIEARAEILRIRICGQNLKSYLLSVNKHFIEDMRINGLPDNPTQLYSLSAVLCAFYLRDYKDKGVDKDTWWSDKCEMLRVSVPKLMASLEREGYHKKLVICMELMEPFAEYLNSVVRELNNNLDKSRDDNQPAYALIDDFSKLTSDEMGKMELADEIWMYVDAWYRGRESVLKKIKEWTHPALG